MPLRRGGALEVWRESRTTESSKESLEWHVGASTMESSELQFLPQRAGEPGSWVKAASSPEVILKTQTSGLLSGSCYTHHSL